MNARKARDAARRLKRLRRGHLRILFGRTAGSGVMVLGMHRSGTSVATRTISMLGPSTCLPGDMIRGPWNPQGHYESQTMVEVDDHLLAQMGCTWWSPPATGTAYSEAAAKLTTSKEWARHAFLKVHPVSPWVWKDPRAVLLIPFWRSALGSRAAALMVFRSPLDVASSLQRRHDVSLEFGVALWERYNRLLLAHMAGMDALVVSFEDIVREPTTWVHQARDFVVDLGMSSARASEDLAVSTVEPGLSHGSPSAQEAVSPGAYSVYRELEKLRGRHRSFEPPVLADESPAVTDRLEAIGPHRKLHWRPPSSSRTQADTEGSNG